MSNFTPEPMQDPDIRSYAAATDEERLWALACHLTGLSILFGVPGFVGPLVIWLIKKEQMPLVNDQGKESLNFQLSLLIYSLAAWVPVLTIVGLVLIPLSLLITIAVTVFGIVMCIIAGLRAQQGEYYRYPFTLRLIK